MWVFIIIICILILAVVGIPIGIVENEPSIIIIGAICLTIVATVIAYMIYTHIQKKKGMQYLTANFGKIKELSEKYAGYAEKYIQNISKLHKDLFGLTFDGTYNAFIEKNRSKFSALLQAILEYDGFKQGYPSTIYSTEIENAWQITALFSIEIKAQIAQNNEWLNKNTLQCVLYFIVRNYLLSNREYATFIPNGITNSEIERRVLANEIPHQSQNTIEYKDIKQANDCEIYESQCTNCGGRIIFDKKGNGVCPYCQTHYTHKHK